MVYHMFLTLSVSSLLQNDGKINEDVTHDTSWVAKMKKDMRGYWYMTSCTLWKWKLNFEGTTGTKYGNSIHEYVNIDVWDTWMSG